MGKAKSKTHKATSKRFKISGSGKVRHSKQNDNAHLKVNKSGRKLRRQEGKGELAQKKEIRKIKALLS